MSIDDIIIGIELFIMMLGTIDLGFDATPIVDTLVAVIDNINGTFLINHNYRGEN